jgi:hypothetical protein
MELELNIDNNSKKLYNEESQKKADSIIQYFIIVFFLFGLAIAPIYDTWWFGLGIGSINMALFFIAKFLIKNKYLARMIVSLILAIYMLQFIGQSHGMAEFHFFFFTNIALLIIYKDWRLMIPYVVFTVAHHSIFFYFQLLGVKNLGIYFILCL